MAYEGTTALKHKRRFCRMPGCSKIVKSQGLCQRHGAKTRKCKTEGCEKQAQGNFDGMCKSHFKQSKYVLKEESGLSPETPPPPEGSSVYDAVLPMSINYTPSGSDVMPLVSFLKEGFDQSRPRGWHRNAERRARGLWPVSNAAIQLEGWERELVWMEICILSGSPQASFRHLARAWGRDKGFHMVLAQFICERRGDVERKKRKKGEKHTKKLKRNPLDLADGDSMSGILDFDDMDESFDGLSVLNDAESDSELTESTKARRRPSHIDLLYNDAESAEGLGDRVIPHQLIEAVLRCEPNPSMVESPMVPV